MKDEIFRDGRVRVAAACESCRSKRKKCDGVKPACGLCERRRIPCTWRDTKVGSSRGPNRGYYSAMEARLRATESLLVQCIELLDPADLDKLILLPPETLESGHREQTGSTTTALKQLQKERMDLWSAFPLNSRASLDDWHAYLRSGEPPTAINLQRAQADVPEDDVPEDDIQQSNLRVLYNAAVQENSVGAPSTLALQDSSSAKTGDLNIPIHPYVPKGRSQLDSRLFF